MLKRLVTIQEFVKVSSVLNPDNINLELDIDSALNNFNNLSKIDKQTIKLQQYLDQAGKQIDSFSNGQIYNMWDYINSIIEAGPNEHVNSIQIADYKNNIDTIKYVIIKWVEVFIYTHQVFVDANVEAPSNLPFNIEGKSDNANIEVTRLDLINILNTTFFFEKVYVTGSVEDSRFNPFTDLGQFSGLEIGPLDTLNYKFSNGYIVKDVPYLGLENKGRLDLLEPKIEDFNTKINQNTTNIKQLQDLTNTHTRDIDTLKKKTQQNTDYIGGFYKEYTQYTTFNNEQLQEINERISAVSGGLKFKGVWNATTSYLQGDMVDYQGEFYASNINNNLGITPKDNPTQWTKLPKSDEATIRKIIEEYVAELQKQITKINNELTKFENQLVNAELDIEELKTNFNNIKSSVETNTEDINTLRKDQEELAHNELDHYNELKAKDMELENRINNISIANMVTTDTPQDITATKTFKNDIKINGWTLNDSNGSLNFQYGGNTFSLSSLGTSTFDNDIVLKKNMVSYVAEQLKDIDLTNYLKLNTQNKQEVQGPVNFSNATINNYRVLTTQDLEGIVLGTLEIKELKQSQTKELSEGWNIIEFSFTPNSGFDFNTSKFWVQPSISGRNNGIAIRDIYLVGNEVKVSLGVNKTETGTNNVKCSFFYVVERTGENEYATKKYVDDAIAKSSGGTKLKVYTNITSYDLTANSTLQTYRTIENIDNIVNNIKAGRYILTPVIQFYKDISNTLSISIGSIFEDFGAYSVVFKVTNDGSAKNGVNCGIKIIHWD